MLGWAGASGAEKAVFYVKHCTDPSNCGPVLTGTTVLSKKEWHHIAGVADSDGNAVLYVDGKAEANADLSCVNCGGDINYASTLKIGILTLGAWRFDGMLDEISVYRGALTAGDIELLYAKGLGERLLGYGNP